LLEPKSAWRYMLSDTSRCVLSMQMTAINCTVSAGFAHA
jgi:hypothetical protein